MIENYNDFINYLYSYQDLEYKKFHSKIILCDNLIGIRTPILKKIARNLSKDNYKLFFKLNKHNLYEEKLLHGLTLGYLDLDFNDLEPLLEEFLPFIDNWAICDLTASNFKIFNKIDDIGFNIIKKYLKDKNFWINRFGFVLLIDYYINDKYINSIFELLNNYKDEYYVKMSIAWLVSMCYIKYPNKTLIFLKNNKLDKWTYNKSIQKIIESRCIDKNTKEMLKEMKLK